MHFSFACLRGLMCFAPLARSHLLPVGGGNGGRFVNRPYARNQSCACRAGACSRRGVRCKLTAGASPRPTDKPICIAKNLRVVETPTPTHEMECVCPTNPNLELRFRCDSVPGHKNSGKGDVVVKQQQIRIIADVDFADMCICTNNACRR